MKKWFFPVQVLLLAGLLAACGGNDKQTDATDAPPAAYNDDEEHPNRVLNTVVNDRMQVTMEMIGPSEDTVASLISGFVDGRNINVAPADMKLSLHTKALVGQKPVENTYEMKIAADGRVPGIWVNPGSACRFTLVAATDTFHFESSVATAMYRFKITFRPKA